MMVGAANSNNMGNTLENSFVQTAVNKSYERILGETIDANPSAQ
jgi:hypothetical protein